jgi:protocatechuate 3,4-dioxygenase beta subunit
LGAPEGDMSRFIAVVVAAHCLFTFGAGARAAAPADRRRQEPVVGLPCEGCEAVFDGLPVTLAATARIAPPEEPGQAMRIVGTVFAKDGHSAPGVIVYAYHTNSRGIYPTAERSGDKPGSRHGRLRGWAKTDGNGRYRFDTIRPAGYPDSDLPAHVHMHVIEVGRCTYWIDDIMFDDDPRLTAEKRRQFTNGRGGTGFALPHKDGDGNWTVTRDIFLGTAIPGYPEGAQQPATKDGATRPR